MGLPFIKMNGLGNDFVIVSGAFTPSPAEARSIADRARGIGCDQLIVLGPSDRADVVMRIYNADGGEVGRCGNAERCVAWLTMRSDGREETTIETASGISRATLSDGGGITVDMGEPGLDWSDIPLAREMDTAAVQIRIDEALNTPGCVSMGNPHAVFFVEDAEEAPVATAGPLVETHWLFPERTNVEFVSVIDRDRLRMRVWERGAGITQACGTGACAAVVAAHRRGLCERAATVVLDGGELAIEWRVADGHVLMTGPVAVEFTGHLPELETVS